jgi:lactate dehydrogenase-like 2-hydroxyacid dehydrogenase
MPRKVMVYSPHLGGHTLESHVAMQDCVIANLEAFFAGQPLPCGSGRVKGWFRADW